MTRALAAALLLLSLLFVPLGIYGNLAAIVLYLAVSYRSPTAPSSTTWGSLGGSAGGGSAVTTAALFATFLVVLMFRWPAASHDVEHYIGPDEGEVVENVLEMIRTGDFDQRHPGYPGLHFYLQMIPARVHLAVTGKSIPELPRSDFYARARRWTLVAGLLAAVATFAAGRCFLSSWGAALAAALVALSPLAFRESAVVNPDLMLMLFVTVSLFFSLRLLERRSSAAFLLAGCSVGLATAIKYTGGLAVAPYLAACCLGSEPRRNAGKSLAGLFGAAASFMVTSPYTLLHLDAFLRGLEMHVGYYRASDVNAPRALTRQLAARGVGLVAALAAFASAVRALSVLDRKLLVLLAYPLAYLMLFSFFDRAFPRHALVLVPFTALAAAIAVEELRSRRHRLAIAVATLSLAGPLWGTIDLARRMRRPSPAESAAVWAEANIPSGGRILQDQFTPRLDPERFRVHRLRVEEKRFVGNFDWVFHSGYPPGLRTAGLREVARFENENAIGDLIVVYQVPERESLMPVSFARNRRRQVIGAGDLPFFGDGWYPPGGGAYETSRLSKGASSEIFFVLPSVKSPVSLEAELTLGAVGGATTEVEWSLNDVSLGRFTCSGERSVYELTFPAEQVGAGLNRLVLSYGELTRQNRRRPDTALRFFRMRLSR